MSNINQKIQWLSSNVSQDSKDLLVKFYGLADSHASDAGQRMATEVFTNDAHFVAVAGSFIGSEAIAKSREHAWDDIATRKHTLLKVFASDQDPQELVVIGRVEFVLKNDKKVEGDFAGLIQMAPAGSTSGPRISRMKALMDSSPLRTALEN